ncbi:hypothetical protein ACN47E_006256 [Coniothyrium glycines]
MPPRKRTKAAAKKEGEKGVTNGLEVPRLDRNVKKVDSGYLGGGDEQEKHQEPSAGDKRKKSVTPEATHKAVKTAQPTKEEEAQSSAPKASPVQVLKFLLSDAALDVCRPTDEIEATSTDNKDLVTYSQLLTPFEELLCAVVLSRPISHRLGLRTIRTILNPPYEFRTPVAIKTAGAQKVRRALDDAHTQHKDKTADEIDLLADAVSHNDWHNDLGRLRKQSKGSVEAEREVLRRSIKGLGKTGLDIFYRRIQWLWEEAFPFVDSRTLASLQKLGLSKRPEGLVKMIEVRWSELDFKDSGEYSEDEKRRRAFVLLLERAVGADLEKKIDEVLREASKL